MIQHFFKIAFIIILCAFSVAAQNTENSDSLKTFTIPSITVTTSRAKFIESPIPFSEMTKNQIEKNYTTQDLPNLISELPSITFYSENGNSIGYSYLTMRGIDQSRISVMVNGIPQNDPEDHNVYWIDFPDIASNLDDIQIQRGSGLTSYGPAAIAGSINLTTSNFVKSKGVRLYSGIGWQEYGVRSSGWFNPVTFQPITNKYSMEVSSGMVDNYAFYGRLSNISSLGYRDRSFTNLNSFFLSAARFDKNFSTQINVFGGPLNDGLAYNGIPKSYISDVKLRRLNPAYDGWYYDSTGRNITSFTQRRPQEVEEFSQPHYEILNDWEITPNLSLKSALFYYTGGGYFDQDGSWANDTNFRMTKEYGFDTVVNPTNAIYRAFVGNRQWGWLPRFVLKLSNQELTGGLEMRFHRSEHWGQLLYAENLPPGYNPDYKFYFNRGKRDIFSAFLRDKYDFNNNFSMFAEGHFIYNTYTLSDEKAGNLYTQYLTVNNTYVGNGGDIFTVKYLFFDPKIGFNYIINNDMNVYALAAYTSNEPTMRNLYAADDAFFGATPLFSVDTTGGIIRYDFSKPLVKPEEMLDIELGWNWKTEDYLFSADWYWMQYHNELVSSGRLDIVGNPIDGNAPSTYHTGIELSGSVNLFKEKFGTLSLSANATFSINKILDYDFYMNSQEKISLKNNDIAGFPTSMANIRLNYQFSGLFCSLYMKYVGQSRTDNFGDLITTNPDLINYLKKAESGYYSDNILDDYTVFNFDISYSFKKIYFFPEVKIQMQINNLFNRLYASGAIGKEFYPAAERNIFLGIELGI